MYNDERATVRSHGEVQHPVSLQGLTRSALVDGQFADPDQPGAGDVACQAQQAGGVYLIVMAEPVRGSQQRVLDFFMQGTGLLLEQCLECPVQQLFRGLFLLSVFILTLDT